MGRTSGVKPVVFDEVAGKRRNNSLHDEVLAEQGKASSTNSQKQLEQGDSTVACTGAWHARKVACRRVAANQAKTIARSNQLHESCN